MKPNRYIFDLDNTLCTQEENYADAKPIPERIAYVNHLYEQGHHITIDTARGSVTGNVHHWYMVTRTQLNRWKVKHHKLRVGEKLDADYFIDDKAINADHFFMKPEIDNLYNEPSA